MKDYQRKGRHKASGRKGWYYKPTMLDNIRALEADGQPWAIARYRTAARFVAGDTAVIYELIIFQTYGAPEGFDTLMMNKDDFYGIFAALGISTQPIHESRYGRIFGRDNRLRDAVKAWERQRAENTAKERQLFAQYTRASQLAASKPENEELAEERKAARRAYKAAVERNATAAQTFLQEHQIIQYNF